MHLRKPTIMEMDNASDKSQTQHQKDNKRSWDQYYHELLEFINENGHSSVPPTNSGLHRWTRSQRYEYAILKKGRASALKPSQVEKLDNAQFVWSLQNESWENMFRQLREYFGVHGHCSIPYNQPQYSKLRNWLYVQKRMINDTNGYNKHQEKLNRLIALGVEPYTRRTKWEELLTSILDYKASHPQSNTIPARFVSNNMLPLGRQFHYLKGQWKLHSNNQPHRLTSLQIKQLEQTAIDFLVLNNDAINSETEQKPDEPMITGELAEATEITSVEVITIDGVVSMEDWIQNTNRVLGSTNATIQTSSDSVDQTAVASTEASKKPSAVAVNVSLTQSPVALKEQDHINHDEVVVVDSNESNLKQGTVTSTRGKEYVKKGLYCETIKRNTEICGESTVEGDYMKQMLAQLKTRKKEASYESVVTIGSDTITCYDLCTLQPGNFLNDAVIQGFLRLVDEQRMTQEKDSTKSLALFNTHFCAKLNPEHFTTQVQYEFNEVHRYAPIHQTRAQANPFMYSKLLIPINFAMAHWGLLVVDMSTKTLTTIDSLRETRRVGPFRKKYYEKCERILDWLEDWKKYQEDTNMEKQPYDRHQWTVIEENCPQQLDGYNCGVFMCLFIHNLTIGKALDDWDHKAADKYRNYIGQSILFGRLMID